MFNDIRKYAEFRQQMLGAAPGQPDPPDGSKGNSVQPLPFIPLIGCTRA